MKQGKLYTVTKGNLFAFGDPIKRADVLASRLYGENYGDKGFTLQDYMNDKGKNWFGISKKNNPFSKMNIGNTIKGVGAGAALAASAVNTGDPRGFYDTLDPVYHLAGGRESGAGNAMSDAGVGLFNAGAQSGNAGLMLAGAGAKVLGGLTNAAFGLKTDKDKLNRINQNIADFNSSFDASNFDEVGTANLTTNASGVYKGGWFSGGRARRKNAALQADLDNSLALARNNINNNIQNIASDQMSNMMRNYAAYGGALETAALPQYTEPGIGVAEYDFMKDYLTTKRMQAESKNKLSGVQSVAANNMFDMGGKKKKKDNRTILQKANDWFDETFPNRNKPVVEMIPEWLYTSPLKYLMNDDEQKTNYGGAVNSFNGQGAGGGWGTAPYVPKNTKSFSEAFDEARQAGAEDFIFGDKVYNTIKEANPIREFNNRIVGNSRTEKQIRARKGYGKDFGPIQTKEAVLPIIPYAEGGTLFALGGDYQTNGADWTNGLVSIDAGGSHESNPYEGVQMGVDPEGTPNLVEEGERIFNDYVYSKRIFADGGTLEKFHLSKKRKISFADLAGLLEKESKERPNDPISIAALKVQMEQLAEQQERQKQEMEAARAREAFEALSPEEQTALMQQAAQQEQMAQEQAIQEQAMAEQAAAEQQPTPEEIAMTEQQQQMMQADGSQAALGQAPQMACGGRINKFDEGGMKQKIYNLLKLKTKSDWDAWVKKNGLDGLNDFEDWDNALQNQDIISAITKDNPALADALEKGYDFGQYKAPSSKYDLEAFRKVLSEYTKSKKQGNTQGMYAIDKDFGLGNYKTIKELEESPEYKAYTQYLTDMLNRAKGIQWRRKDKSKTGVYDNVEFKDGKTLSKEDYDTLLTLAKTAEGTRTKDKGDYVPIFDYDADKDGWYGLRDDALQTVLRLRGDQKGGIFHLNPTAIKRGTQANNYVINEDGTVEALEGGLDGLKLDSTYQWADPQTDYTNNYYRRVVAANANGQNGTAGNNGSNGNNNPATGTGDDREVVPIHSKLENLRWAGLLGPAVGLGMQLAGIGRPDTSGLDAAVNMSRGAGHLADYQPIGDYMRYQPLDRLFYANQLQANARATDRNLMNTSGGNRGAAMAGLLANSYNTNNNLGNLWRQAEEYNLAQRERVAAFNKDTNKFNADAYNTTSRFNADALNRQGQYSAQLAMQAAREKMDADAAWNQGIYGNVAGLFKGIGDLGRENAQHNMIADMAATGIFGTIKNQPIGNGYIRVVPRNEAAKGGKINKKKGKEV